MTESHYAELFSLRGSVALVTGASGAIGGELARVLASAGAELALSGRSAARLERLRCEIVAAGGTAQAFPADLAELESIEPLVQSVRDRFAHIDILINCAGTNQRMPIGDVSPEVYDQLMAVNLRSPYFLTQQIARGMAEAGRGKIVHIGSLTTQIGLGGVSVYGMSKSALAQLTKTMAVEWAAHNIQINCLCPGFIATELTEPLWSHPRRREWILDRLPIKRPGRPDDLAGMALLLSSRASDYITGQTIFVDGGFTAGSPW